MDTLPEGRRKERDDRPSVATRSVSGPNLNVYMSLGTIENDQDIRQRLDWLAAAIARSAAPLRAACGRRSHTLKSEP